MKTIFNLAVLVCGLAALPMQAQIASPPPMTVYQPLSAQQLDQVLGPIALYPDPLVAEILPAATLPTQIVMADRYVTGGGDPNLIAQQPWDASVQAVAHYPNVLKYLDDNLNWTAELGQAFLYQQSDVMSSVQRLRAEAQSLGNLQSTAQQDVETDDGDIEIVPADPDVIYVPVYQPDVVYVQSGFGSPFISFGVGFPIGFWLGSDFDWHNRNLVVWDREHPRPANWWHEQPAQRNVVIRQQTTVWRADTHQDAGAFNRGDRGWTAPAARPEVNRQAPRVSPAPFVAQPEAREARPAPAINQPRPAAERPVEPVETHTAPQPVRQPAVNNRPESGGAFIGVQSAHDTKTFSERGQQSINETRPQPAAHTESVSHSEPAPSRPASPPPSGGSGGSKKH
jgi:hypothetical protein